jgi:alcohol dehydrogenase class IV
MSAVFHAPSALHVGAGTRNQLPAELQRYSVRRVLTVTDAFLKSSGLIDELSTLLRKSGVEASVFANVQPDPTDQNVCQGLAAYRESGAEAIVAVGGGSPIDAAKAIGSLVHNEGPLSEFQGYHRIPLPGPPLVAIPTTAGTGSEATKVAVITDTARQVKMMILDRKLMPAVAIVDYELSMSMPPALTAHVGVDTLTHGIEAYVSRKANAMTDPIALSCIRLTARHLLAAFREPGNRAAREAMAVAACHGGMAFTNSGLCLVHGMSRPIGALYHLPHGLSNAVLLPTVTRYSLPGASERYAEVARTMGLAGGASALIDGLERLNEDLAIPRLGACLRSTRQDFEATLAKMASDALASGSPNNNPLIPSAEEIVALYQQAW